MLEIRRGVTLLSILLEDLVPTILRIHSNEVVIGWDWAGGAEWARDHPKFKLLVISY